MSKLDWFTILVIAVCVLAIGALIWNAKGLMDNNKKAEQTERNEDYVDTDTEDKSDIDEYAIDVDGDGDGDNGANTNGSAGGSSAIQYDSDVAREAAEADAEEARMAEREAAEEAARARNSGSSGAESGRINTNTSPSSDNGISSKSATSTTGSSSRAARSSAASSSAGKYMVLIGSYTQMISAERMLRSVRSKGYRSAKIEKFNGGKYARVLVDRRKTLNSARDLQAELVSDGFRDIQIKEK